MPPIIAYHAVWSVYGFWPPNDERGSWSREVWAPHLRRFGPATTTTERRSAANRPFDRQRRREIRAALKYPAVRFSTGQIECIARGFEVATRNFDIDLYACAILWDHVHIVVARHRENVEFVARVLKSAATRQLTSEGLHPLRDFADATGGAPTPWAEGGWERYLHDHQEIIVAVDYVNGNPLKHDLPRQEWGFVHRLER